MKRILTSFVVMALAAASTLFAQNQTDFRAASSGTWTNSGIWEKNQDGIWLKPIADSYPGDSHDRNVNVTIDDQNNIEIGEDETVHINSLSVFDGRLLVKGMLIVGPGQDDQENPEGNSTPAIQSTVTPSENGIPQLEQNVPNPLAPQFGYETTIRFYLDRQYGNVLLTLYDQLGHLVQKVYQEENPSSGWHEIRVRLDNVSSGTYPLLLELPNNVLRRMITVVK
jgi:hypothetical protein